MTTWKDVPQATLREIATELHGNGWGIYGPEYLEKKGVPEALVMRATRHHASDGTPKGTITNTKTGAVASSMAGIYSLDLLETICRDLELEVQDYIGRGSQAWADAEAILSFCS